MSLPDVDVIRTRIEKVEDPLMCRCLMALYLFDARICEVVAIGYASDKKSTPYGKLLDAYKTQELGHTAIVFKVPTAKKKREKGKLRFVALPPEFESWAEPVYDWMQKHDPAFPVTRQDVSIYIRRTKLFEGLTYPIYYYNLYEGKVIVKRVQEHLRPFRLHALRHLRTTELVDDYNFDGIDLALYGGWSYQSIMKMETGNPYQMSAVGVLAGIAKRYTHMQWKRYFPKLLKKR